jgi:gamma-glutamylcyclotransferase (GGCT)/AIG2-like uncharacterized protein YtfP
MEPAGDSSLSPTRRLIFVYGTLKRGHVRHFALAAQRYLGEATTRPRYRMVNLGSYPALIEGGSSAIVGELWEVDATCLALLDEIESVADSYYRRGSVALAPPYDDLSVEAYFYDSDVSDLPDHGESW